MESKTDYRLYAKELRKKLDMKAESAVLAAKIRQNEFYVKAEHVMIFYPVKYEVDLLELLDDKKNFYLPKVSGKELLVCPFGQNLKKSAFNIMEPCSKPVNPEALDLVIVPALMADKNGFRLGYGGGFYDRFLAGCKAKTITAIPKELFVDSLPCEKFDVKIDFVITT